MTVVLNVWCRVDGTTLHRKTESMLDGQYREAGIETLAAVAAPALMSYASTASLVLDVVDGAYELADPAMEGGHKQPGAERAPNESSRAEIIISTEEHLVNAAAVEALAGGGVVQHPLEG